MKKCDSGKRILTDFNPFDTKTYMGTTRFIVGNFYFQSILVALLIGCKRSHIYLT